MDVQKKLLNASEAAEYLGVYRPKFYQMMEDWGLEPVMQTGRIKLYAIKDLNRMERDYEHC